MVPNGPPPVGIAGPAKDIDGKMIDGKVMGEEETARAADGSSIQRGKEMQGMCIYACIIYEHATTASSPLTRLSSLYLLW